MAGQPRQLDHRANRVGAEGETAQGSVAAALATELSATGTLDHALLAAPARCDPGPVLSHRRGVGTASAGPGVVALVAGRIGSRLSGP